METFYNIEDKKTRSIEEKLQLLDLFGLNIQESLNLTPIFKQLYTDIHKELINNPAMDKSRERLLQIAENIKEKQITTLGERRIPHRKMAFSLKVLKELDNQQNQSEQSKLSHEYTFTSVDGKKHYVIFVKLVSFGENLLEARIRTELYLEQKPIMDNSGVWISLFDLPLTNITQLNEDLSCVVFLDKIGVEYLIYSIVLLPQI
jgi:hypothetical protein